MRSAGLQPCACQSSVSNGMCTLGCKGKLYLGCLAIGVTFSLCNGVTKHAIDSDFSHLKEETPNLCYRWNCAAITKYGSHLVHISHPARLHPGCLQRHTRKEGRRFSSWALGFLKTKSYLAREVFSWKHVGGKKKPTAGSGHAVKFNPVTSGLCLVSVPSGLQSFCWGA